MTANVHDIKLAAAKYVPVLKGASQILVTHRELRNTYKTNRSIKTWATYFLLKSCTTSGLIKNWLSQRDYLTSYCKMTENCLRARLRELKELGLVEITKNKNITLCSFEAAADILGIAYTGTIKIEYDNDVPGHQVFQYHLVMDEIRCNQELQQEAIIYKANKNPDLKNVLDALLVKNGADMHRLEDKKYFQENLLRLQTYFFKVGSDIWDIISELRADVNRSVEGIKRQYGYASAQSVSYLKKRLHQLKIALINKVKVESEVRTRLYVPDENGKRKDGAKYCHRTKKTVLFLCDQLIPQIKIKDVKPKTKAKLKVA